MSIESQVKRFLWLCFALVVGLTSASGWTQELNPKQAPNWLLQDAQGQYLSFYDDSAERPALLIFWTPDCAQLCQQNIVELQRSNASLALQQRANLYLLPTGDYWNSQSYNALPAAITRLSDASSVGRFYQVGKQSKAVLVGRDKQVLAQQPLNEDKDTLLRALTNLTRE